jgi:hypothetical protein
MNTAPRGLALLTVVALSCSAAPETRACQACLEDKIAATYDWQVVSAAGRQGHTVVFAAMQGPVTPDDQSLERRLTHELLAVPGVDAGSVRVSLSPPALSFASNLANRSAESLVRAANRRLRSLGIALTVVRIGAPAARAGK